MERPLYFIPRKDYELSAIHFSKFFLKAPTVQFTLQLQIKDCSLRIPVPFYKLKKTMQLFIVVSQKYKEDCSLKCT